MAGAEHDWSYCTTFEATPMSAAGARAFVSQHLVADGLTHLVESVRLVVSELATNALVHGRTPFAVTVSREDDTVRVSVSDDSAWIVARAPEHVLRAGGRGLGIVEVLSLDWGIIMDVGSKAVWATFDAPRARSS